VIVLGFEAVTTDGAGRIAIAEIPFGPLKIVEDQDFQDTAFDGLADEIFDSVVAAHS
jgi:hypothetical protein